MSSPSSTRYERQCRQWCFRITRRNGMSQVLRHFEVAASRSATAKSPARKQPANTLPIAANTVGDTPPTDLSGNHSNTGDGHRDRGQTDMDAVDTKTEPGMSA
jgi:hypothetical protein